MAKGCKSKKASSVTAKLLAMFLAIGLLAVLGTAGLLSYYGKVVGTVTVQQSVQISQDGTNWMSCNNNNVENCKVTYSGLNVVAGSLQNITQTLYIRNNANQQVTFRWEYSIPRDLFDGIVKLAVWVNSSSEDCDQKVPIFGYTVSSSKPSCSSDVCTFQVGIETLNGNEVRKYCGFELELDPRTIPGTYQINLTVIPV